jgi:hypothetical protein
LPPEIAEFAIPERKLELLAVLFGALEDEGLAVLAVAVGLDGALGFTSVSPEFEFLL